jgi:hypothetical protein
MFAFFGIGTTEFLFALVGFAFFVLVVAACIRVLRKP